MRVAQVRYAGSTHPAYPSQEPRSDSSIREQHAPMRAVAERYLDEGAEGPVQKHGDDCARKRE
jgi:hypothetical protein